MATKKKDEGQKALIVESMEEVKMEETAMMPAVQQVAPISTELMEYEKKAIASSDPKRPEILNKISARIQELKGSMEDHAFEVARLLWIVHTNELWRDKGYESFKEYSEKEFNFAERAGQYLRLIWETFAVKLADKPEALIEVRPVGWTKAATIAPVVDKYNFKEWIDSAKVNTVKDLAGKVKEEKNKRKQGKDPKNPLGKPKEPSQHLGCTLKGEQIENVMSAIDKAKKIGGTNKVNQALNLICVEYSNSNVFAGDPNANIAEVFQRTANVFGVLVMVMRKGETEAILNMMGGIGGEDEEGVEQEQDEKEEV